MSIGSAAYALDWNDVRFFLAVAREGSLARAASALGVDQTTVGRRIGALESKLKVAVFTRATSGLQLTVAGQRVMEAASRMGDAAVDVSRHAADETASSGATVRIATTENLAEVFVVPAIRALREQEPRIRVVVMSSWTLADLRKGEADVAIRLVKPSDPRLVSRRVAQLSLQLYASREYVGRYGPPTSLDGHSLIAFEETIRSGSRSAFVDLPMLGGELAFLTNSGRLLLVAALAGLGIVELPSYIGDAVPGLVRVLAPHASPYAVWLVVPQSSRRIAAVRAVSEAITESFAQRKKSLRASAHR